MLSRSGSDAQLQRVAELRMAQVLLHLQRYDEVLAALGDSDDTAFAGQFHDLRGDLYFAQNQLDDARMEYLAALAAPGTSTIDRSFVQMKLDDVSGSATAEAPADDVDVGVSEPEPVADAGSVADAEASDVAK
jgi:predicted negative regulator of RcsB-dependent stress response